MEIKEIRLQDLNPKAFIDEKVSEIAREVGGGSAISALSGGVDSSVVTMLGHRALGDRLNTIFIENGLMREGEPEHIAAVFGALGVAVKIVDAKRKFFGALKGVSDPEEK